MDLGLAGKTAIVTGGGSNIGRAIFFTLVREGANVVNAELDEKQGQKVVEEANTLGGGRALLVKTDVTDSDSVQEMVKKALAEFGQIDILVNNVGWTSPDGAFVAKPREHWEKEINLVFWSGINCCRAVAEHMVERKQGVIVNISSGAGRVGQQRQTVYSGVKGAVIAFSKSLARELGRHGIRVNVICPGLIVPENREVLGEMSVWSEWSLDRYGSPEVQEKMAKVTAVGRVGRPQDVANMVAVLASDRASYITGQTISVDGGASMV